MSGIHWLPIILLLALHGPLTAGESATCFEEVTRLAPVSGGLSVHVECGNGETVAAFARTRRFLAHGLTSDASSLQSLRQRLAAEGLAGFASIESLPLNALPYADHLVSFLLAEDFAALQRQGMDLPEILRVLSPLGKACLGVGSEQKAELDVQLAKLGVTEARFELGSRLWLVLKKPRPAGMDDWTHSKHGPDGNLVSRDLLLERPNQLQWIAGPHWPSARMAGVPGASGASAVRSVQGRNYYLSGGMIVARDAFNGVMLWARRIGGFKHDFVIAEGDEVYLSRESELLALAGSSGEVRRSYGTLDGCHGLLLSGGLLLAFESKQLRAFDTASGMVRWTSAEVAGGGRAVSHDGRVYASKGAKLVCLDLAKGEMLWQKDAAELGKILFAFEDKLLLSGEQGVLNALSGKDGSLAWSFKVALDPKAKLGDIYYASGLIWIQMADDRSARSNAGLHNPKGGDAYKFVGLNPTTGVVQRTLPAPVMLKYRCHQVFATERFLLGNRPIYFTDWKDGSTTRFEGTRMECGSSCGLGQGMFFGLYTNSNKCMCIRQALSGITAFASDRKTADGTVAEIEQGRLETGPAPVPEAATPPDKDEWPMYRSDARRGAFGPPLLPGDLSIAWQCALLPTPAHTEAKTSSDREILRNDWMLNKVSGDDATQPTVAAGKVFVSLTHAQQLVALDEQTGVPAWSFCAASRLDAPPTVVHGICMLACHDGWVYGLRADDGRQVWRFRAAPAERRMVAYGQIESAWPVIGGVLAVGDTAYVVAGRTTESDGGLYVHALDIRTGKTLWSDRRVKPDDGPIGAWNLRHSMTYFGPSDLLVSDGKTVAIAGHSRGHFDCKSGGNISDRPFGGPQFGWMRSRYASDNQRLDYAPRAATMGRSVTLVAGPDKKSTGFVSFSGKPGWKAALPRPNLVVEALAGAGDPAGGAIAASAAPACPLVRVRVPTQAPRIDGELDALYAEHATPLAFGFLDGAPRKPNEATTGYLLCDAENLYLALRCEKQDLERLVCQKTKRDDDIWQDECVEIFLDPLDERSKNYIHLIVNPAGVTQESRAGDTAWNPKLEVKCGREAGKAWIAEIRIPIKELLLKDGKAAPRWSINLNRSARQAGQPETCEDTSWSPTFGTSSHVPDRFGRAWLDALPGGEDAAACAGWQKEHTPPEKHATPAPAAQFVCAVVLAACSKLGASGGFLYVFSARDGALVSSVELPSAPVFDGLAVAKGKVFLSLQDGSVMCLKAP